MNVKELVREVSLKTNYTQKDITTVVNAIVETIEDTVANGDEVNIQGFGKFNRVVRQPKNVRNPKTGEKMVTRQMLAPVFKFGSDFKRKVRGY